MKKALGALPWILLTVAALLWASAVYNNKIRPIDRTPKRIMLALQSTPERQMFLGEPRFFARAYDGTRCGISQKEWMTADPVYGDKSILGKEFGCANGWLKPAYGFGESNYDSYLVAPAPSPWSNP